MRIVELTYQGNKITGYVVEEGEVRKTLSRDVAIRLVEEKGCENAEVRSRQGTKFLTGKGCNLTELNAGKLANNLKNKVTEERNKVNKQTQKEFVKNLAEAEKFSKNTSQDIVKGKILNVVDVSAAMRVYHHNTRMMNLSWNVDGKQFPTKAMFGLFRLFKAFDKGSKSVFCADRRSVRKDMSKDYKKDRIKASEDYYIQVKEVERILSCSGFNLLAEEGMEADDFIASTVRKYRDEYDRIFVWTNDRDLCHLIDSKVYYKSVITNLPDINLYNYESVLNVPYNTITLYKATVGDSSDKIPGVTGFGNKAFLNIVDFARELGYALDKINGEEKNIIQNYFEGSPVHLNEALHSLSLVEPILKDVTITNNENFDRLKEEVLRYGMKSIASCL